MIPDSTICGPLKTIRLDDARVNQLLDVLDSDEGGPGRSKRRTPRYRYRELTLRLRVIQQGVAAPVCYVAAARDISATGLAFLHGAYLHKSTRCVVELVTSFGIRHEVNGTVVRCRYVQGNVHEVAVLFDDRINPALYSADAIRTEVLIVDEDGAAARLTGALLRQFNTATDCATSLDRARCLMDEKLYDLIMLDVATLGSSGPDWLHCILAQAYPATLVGVVGASGDPHRCVAAGCDHQMYKPLQPKNLGRMIDQVRKGCLFSVHGGPDMERLVLQFISELPPRIRAMGAALQDGDTATMLRISGALKGEASVVGFPTLSEAAAALEEILLKGAADEVRGLVQKVMKLCLSARAAGSITEFDPGEIDDVITTPRISSGRRL